MRVWSSVTTSLLKAYKEEDEVPKIFNDKHYREPKQGRQTKHNHDTDKTGGTELKQGELKYTEPTR